MVALGSETAFALLRTGLQVRKLWQEVLSVVGLVQLGLVRRSHRLIGYLSPVDLLEPWVRLNLFSVCGYASQALIRVLMKQLHAKVSRIIS